MANFWISRNEVTKLEHRDRTLLNFRDKAYHTLNGLSSQLSLLVSPEAYASPSVSASSENISDIIWDAIVSIEPVGVEQVYDIEVEGTHNFIGNGIFAHNTYAMKTVPEIPRGVLSGVASAPVLEPSGRAEVRQASKLFQVDYKKIAEDYDRRLVRAILQAEDGTYIQKSLVKIYPEVRDLAIQSVTPRFHLSQSNKRILEFGILLADGSRRSLLLIAASGDALDKESSKTLARKYQAIVAKDSESELTHRLGIETDIEYSQPLSDTMVIRENFHVISLEFFEGITLDKLVAPLESLVGIPGYPYSEGYPIPLARLGSAEVEKRANALVDQGILKPADRETVLVAKRAYETSQDAQVLQEAVASLQKIIFELDQAAVEAHFRFYQKTGFIQTDPRRNNVVVSFEAGKPAFRLIDYGSMTEYRSPKNAVLAFDIFEDKVMPGLVGGTVRPWAWTYTADKSGFFDAILAAYGREEGIQFLAEAEMVYAASESYLERESPVRKHIAIYLARVQPFRGLVKRDFESEGTGRAEVRAKTPPMDAESLDRLQGWLGGLDDGVFDRLQTRFAFLRSAQATLDFLNEGLAASGLVPVQAEGEDLEKRLLEIVGAETVLRHTDLNYPFRNRIDAINSSSAIEYAYLLHSPYMRGRVQTLMLQPNRSSELEIFGLHALMENIGMSKLDWARIPLGEFTAGEGKRPRILWKQYTVQSPTRTEKMPQSVEVVLDREPRGLYEVELEFIAQPPVIPQEPLRVEKLKRAMRQMVEAVFSGDTVVERKGEHSQRV